jgi:hypothetical protein
MRRFSITANISYTCEGILDWRMRIADCGLRIEKLNTSQRGMHAPQSTIINLTEAGPEDQIF